MMRVGGGLSALTALVLPWSAAAQTAPADVGASGGAAVSLDVAAPSAGASPAAAAASDAETEAALAALVAEASGGGDADAALAGVEEFKLNLYGFTDFTYTHRLNDFVYASPYPTFMVGNINLYVGAELGGGWRSLTEFRLLYSPNGHVPEDQAFSSQPERVDTTVTDPADYGRPQRWGGVEIERAWLEYSAHPLLTVQGGQWLTPYGIWNVDHGSPVIIGVRRPYVVGEALIPERQTGIQIYGSQLLGMVEIGYHLGLSNGRGPLDSFQDLDKNKAVTGRLFFNVDSELGDITLGGTVYRGRFTDRFSRTVLNTTGETDIEHVPTERYEELGLAADLRWVHEGLTIQGELISREIAYYEGLRPVAFPAPGAPLGYAADYRSVGWYAMAAYRLPWFNIMPFFGGENYDSGQEFVNDAAAIWGGINFRPVPRVVLKAQYTQSWFTGGAELRGDDGIQVLDLQAAWSF